MGNNKLTDINDVLFDLFSRGDEEAFAEVYRSYYNDMFSYGLSLGLNRDLLRDVIHDIFYKIYLDRGKFTSTRHLKFYMLKSVRNAIYDVAKRVKNSELSDEHMSFSLKVDVLDDIIGEEDREQVRLTVERLLGVLTDRQREAIFLRYMKGLEYDEIGEMLGLSPHAVRKLVSRAMGKLKESAPEKFHLLILCFLLFNS
ncbi:sigma-70 family RNA polymerase sigma factor [Alistipes sp. OttesenSCG-928-B03]|nr:sigma-70 family RNA polymerase sigma factor [Alistipes sp. OttesenSCG-928-B03]